MMTFNKFLKKKENNRSFLIAEAGVNHENSFDKAKKMIIDASKSGADSIKFQTYKASTLASKKAMSYWNTKKDEYAKALKSAVETMQKLQAEEKEYKDIISDIENRLSSTDNAIQILQEPYGVVEKIYSEKYPSEEAFAHEGYFPLYKFEYNAAAASPNGSGTHSHGMVIMVKRKKSQ